MHGADLDFSSVDKFMSFDCNDGKYFWSNGYAYGTCQIKAKDVELSILSGSIQLQSFALPRQGKYHFEDVTTISAGERICFQIK